MVVMNELKKMIVGVILFIIFYPLAAIALWSSPDEIVQGGWGKGEKEFGFRSGDTKDQIPRNFLVLSDGKILIEDCVNNRLQIYLQTGAYLKSIVQPGFGLYELDSDKIVSFKWNDQLKGNNIGVYSLGQEQWLWVDHKRSFKYVINIKVTSFNNSIFVWDDKSGYRYSPTGQLLKTYTERPLELGMVERKSLGKGRKEIKVKYPDKEYIVKPKYYHSADDDYLRDQIDNLYAIQRIVEIKNRYTANEKILRHYRVIKFDYCDESPNILDLPINKYKVVGRDDVVGERKEALAEYGKPVVALKGDIYTWKRTPDTYSILKWTWQGEPDAPQSLKASTSKTGITLSWEVPLKDADRVDEYEINRSTDVCGPFRPIATVKKVVLTYEDQKVRVGETYYYQVRAIRDKVPSGYSNKAIGKK